MDKFMVMRDRVEELIEDAFFGEVVEKSNSFLMKVLSYLLFFNPKFMTSYVTTLYPDIYIPEGWKERTGLVSQISTLSHEYVHLRDRKRLGIFFNILYLSPQIFSLLVVLSFISPWFLLSVLFLLPLPAIGRVWLEFRGYRMSMAVNYWLTGDKLSPFWMADQFVTGSYYWMFPFGKWGRCYLSRRFDEELERIKDNDIDDEILLEVREILRGEGEVG